MKELTVTRTELETLVALMARELSSRERGARREPRATLGNTGAGHEANRVSAAGPDYKSISLTPDATRLARLFDHTVLRPEATSAEVDQACEEALTLGCAVLVVQPAFVTFAARRLRGSAVKSGTVVGFPFGAELPSVKRAQAEAAIRAGAQEIDMVMNVGAFRSGDSLRTESDIRGVVEICHAAGARVKVILENAFLNADQKAAACRLAKEAGADFVKTSTGFAPSGATEGDVRLMRKTVGPEVGVKAAGGIRTLGDALKMLQAGANRIGASYTVSILAEASHCVS